MDVLLKIWKYVPFHQVYNIQPLEMSLNPPPPSGRNKWLQLLQVLYVSSRQQLTKLSSRSQRRLGIALLCTLLYLIRRLCSRRPSLPASIRPLSLLSSLPRVYISTFFADLKQHHIKHIDILAGGSECIVELKSPSAQSYRIFLGDGFDLTKLISMLDEFQVQFQVLPPSANRHKFYLQLFLTLCPLIYLALAYRFISQLNAPEKDAVGRRMSKTPGKGRTSFQEVAGMGQVIHELMDVVNALRYPEKFTRVGAKVPSGILLSGPSGTGKTLLARALAAEVDVPFVFCSASDFVEKFVGRGAARVRDLFARARACCDESQSSHYCILFIDEIDALAKTRSGEGSNEEREQTLNQLLIELDGFHRSSCSNNIIVIAATNRPDVLDPAVIRPGRFDKHIHVGYPSAQGRLDILRVHTRHVELAEQLDTHVVFQELARHTSGCSGAELEAMVNDAAILAVRDDRVYVTAEDFHQALGRLVERKKLYRQHDDAESPELHHVGSGESFFASLLSSSWRKHQHELDPLVMTRNTDIPEAESSETVSSPSSSTV